MSSRRITIEVTEEQYDILKWCAKNDSVKVEKWIEQAALRAIPAGSGRTKAVHAQSAAVAEAAFREVDAISEGPTPFLTTSQGPLSPEVAHIPQKNTGGATVAKLQVGEHPCQFLDKNQPPQFYGQCEGTCKSPLQEGRACFYNAVVAPRCDYFRAKLARSLPKTA